MFPEYPEFFRQFALRSVGFILRVDAERVFYIFSNHGVRSCFRFESINNPDQLPNDYLRWAIYDRLGELLALM